MEKFNFVFTADETNLIMNALGGMPFAQVAKLVGNIQKQAEEQLKKPEEE